MKISIITTKPPVLSSGSQVRNYYLIDELSRNKKTNLHVTTLFDGTSKKSFPKAKNITYHELQITSAGPIQKIISALSFKIPYLERLRNNDLSRASLLDSDIIQLQEIDGFMAARSLLKGLRATVVLDAHNVDYLRFQDEMKHKSLISKVLGSIYTPIFKRTELQILNEIDYLLVCSELDKAYFAHYFPSKKILYIPNGVDPRKFKNKNKRRSYLVSFLGLFTYGPNQEGLDFYLKHIHSRVLQALPQYQLQVIGKGSRELARQYADISHITFSGFVENLVATLDKSSICVSPLLSGSGTRLKILEYMAMSKAVVSTSKGAEGLDITPNKNIVISDQPEEFAKQVISLLSKPKLADQIGSRARSLIQEKYDWKKIGQQLNTFYYSIYD